MSHLSPLMTSTNSEWETPPDLFAVIDDEFHFDVDAAATGYNTKVHSSYIERETDALTCRWGDFGTRAWLNPPYGNKIRGFIEATERSLDEGIEVVVALVPARTDTKWFQQAMNSAYAVWFLGKRIRFVGAESAAPFPSAVIVWNRAPAHYSCPAFPMRAWGIAGPNIMVHTPRSEIRA